MLLNYQFVLGLFVWQDYEVNGVDNREDLGPAVNLNILVTNHTKSVIRSLEFNLSNNNDVSFFPEVCF